MRRCSNEEGTPRSGVRYAAQSGKSVGGGASIETLQGRVIARLSQQLEADRGGPLPFRTAVLVPGLYLSV